MSQPLTPVDLTPSRKHQLVTPRGDVEMWLWAENGAWHGPTNMPPERWHSMTAMHAAINGYKLAQGFTAPKPAEPDELLPEDAGKRAVYWLWKAGRVTQWIWSAQDRIWARYEETPATAMAPGDAWKQGFRMSTAREQPAEADPDIAPPRAPVYRMRAEGLTLEEYIKVRRERVRTMRAAADEQARRTRDQLERADMLETELDCLECSMMRVNPENPT